MVEFELLERDGLARLGRFSTPHGTVETPALLPVLHPDPARHPLPARELSSRYGIRAVITSSYIAWRTPPLRALAERDGIHRLVGFEGTVMTDSGAFQQHAYGSVEVGPEEIIEFQGRIGSDIATVLDLFTEPESSHDAAEAALAITEERARAARRARTGLLAVPVQGGVHPDLRARSAASASEIADVLAVGGVVPLMERYRFADLARAIEAARPALTPAAPVHLFGTGHPMLFAFAAMFGVDLFDSSAYHKFARRGDLLFPDGTVPVDRLREAVCRCALCEEAPLREVAKWPAAEREERLARHNLAVSVEEIGRVRQAIRDGTLAELVERRTAAHPALRAGLREAYRNPEVFWPTEPESRRAFREVGAESRDRPSVVRFLHHVERYGVGRSPMRTVRRIPLRPEFLRRIPVRDLSERPIWWQVRTPLGTVPLELSDLYPVGPYLGEEEFSGPPRVGSPADLSDDLGRGDPLGADLARDWADEWTVRQIAALLEWRYGPSLAGKLAPQLRGERSRRTGRLRSLFAGSEPMFVVGPDGLPRPTFRGGERLHELVARGRERVVVHADAAPFVREGRSAFSKFVVEADPALVPGASALLVDPDDALLAVGRLLLAPHEMGRLRKGVAAFVTAHRHQPVPVDEDDEEIGERRGAGAVPPQAEPVMGTPRPPS
jgi:7-cyano-7-deazaguanine tRNA-ribosyltransferase